MPFLLLFPSAKARGPLYPFREFSGERSLQVVLNAVMEIFVKLILLQSTAGNLEWDNIFMSVLEKGIGRSDSFYAGSPRESLCAVKLLGFRNCSSFIIQKTFRLFRPLLYSAALPHTSPR